MDDRQLQSFFAVAKCLNYTNAAIELHVSPATVSRQIAALEQEWQLTLFHRDNHTVSLTPCGAYLYRELQQVYENQRKIIENAVLIHSGYSGTLSFGVLEEITLQGTMQNCLRSYQDRYPDQLLNFSRYSFRGITDGLLAQEIDLAVTLFFNIADIPTLHYRILEHSRDGILISSKNPLAQKKVFHAEDFKNETFIVISDQENSFVCNTAISYCREHGIYPKIRMAPDLDTAMLWVEAGLGLAFSYQNAVSSLNPAMTFIPFAPEEHIPGSMLVLAWNSANSNPAIPAFLNLL